MLAKQLSQMEKSVKLVKAELEAHQTMKNRPPEDRFVEVMTISFIFLIPNLETTNSYRFLTLSRFFSPRFSCSGGGQVQAAKGEAQAHERRVSGTWEIFPIRRQGNSVRGLFRRRFLVFGRFSGECSIARGTRREESVDVQKARRENQKKREADEKQKKAKEARERAASMEIICIYRIDLLLQEKSKRRTKSIRKAQLVDIHGEGDQEGVLDGLLEALKTGSAFAK